MSSSSASLVKPHQRLVQSSYCNCAKFVPQAFNSNKCQSCFNAKDSHTNEALADFQKVTNLNRFFFFLLQTIMIQIYLEFFAYYPFYYFKFDDMINFYNHHFLFVLLMDEKFLNFKLYLLKLNSPGNNKK